MYRSSFNLIPLHDKVRTADGALKFLQSVDILPTTSVCDKCDTVCPAYSYRADTDYHYFACVKCKKQEAITKNTLLYHKNLTMKTFCLLAYRFTLMIGLSLLQTVHEVNFYFSL